MTISYSDHFSKLLCRWRGSLWKTIYRDLIIFLLLYYAIRFIYRYALDHNQMDQFAKLILIFDKFTEQIPLTFMLGFYVGMVVARWWDQFQRISWPDNFLYWVSAYIRGPDQRTALIRRTIARYCTLSGILGWRSISVRVLKRFPTLDHLVKLGLLTESEKVTYEEVQVNFDPHKQWFVPLNWVLSILVQCYDEKRVSHVNELVQLISELQKFRNGFSQLFIYDWITIPLVYTQVAIVGTYGYFALCLIGRQFVDPTNVINVNSTMNATQECCCKDDPMRYHNVDMYIPIFTILQFLFYVGWLKVGEDLMNPFGEDDEDFECNYIIDRNMEMSYLIADNLHGQMPEIADSFPIISNSTTLPHTRASCKIVDKCPTLHVKNVKLTAKDMELAGSDTPPPTNILDNTDLKGVTSVHSNLQQLHNICYRITRVKKPTEASAPLVNAHAL